MFGCRVTLLKATMFLLVACVLTYTLVMLISMDGFRRTAMFHIFSGFAMDSKETQSSTLVEQNLSCQPLRHIYYLKSHKTASTTIANILYRYGDKRNLTFVIPTKAIEFNWPHRFHLFNAYPLYEEPNILCNHARYNKPLINWLFPRPKAKYITTIRNPVSRFESAFFFYDMAKELNIQNASDPIKSFLDAPPRNYNHLRVTKRMFGNYEFPQLYRLRNPILFDLGLDHKFFLNMKAVQNYIDFIDREFDLVMIAEHFDESLILLKQMFCWEFEDIVYFKKNVRKRNSILPQEVERKILAWNRADGLLFDHFNQTLWKKIRLAGPRFHRDLEQFQKLNQYYQHTCPLIMRSRSKSQEQNELLHNCIQMSQSEEKFFPYIEEKYKKTLSDIDKFYSEKEFDIPADSLDFSGSL